MGLLLVGINHRTAPVEIRERLAIACADGGGALRELLRLPVLREVLFLSTCNRVEVLAHAEEDDGAERDLRVFVLSQGNLSPDELARCVYVFRGAGAVRHLFRVAASLDAMVMGEPQILGQVKDAYRRAVDAGATGILLNKTLHHAFRTAKRVRTETGIAANAVSVSFAAVELAKKIFGGLAGKRVLLVGAGEMSELAARHLLRQGAEQIFVANRTAARAEELAAAFQGVAVPFAELGRLLGEVDIVITSTGAPGHVITADMVSSVFRRRRNRLLFLVDIAVPRDIAPEAGEVENVYLYNIDDLQAVVDDNLAIRGREAEKAEAIVAEEVEKHAQWLSTLEVVPTIVSLRERVEGIVRAELEKSAAWLQRLDEEDREHVEILLNGIVNKILHAPITNLKEECLDQTARPYVAAIRRLFSLDGP